MYENYFGLLEKPFSIAPDPRYLYLSTYHREALAHLVYGVENGGFVLLTGEVGAGKTLLCQCLLQQISANCDVALIVNPKLNPEELLAAVCDELKVSYPKQARGNKTMLDRLNDHLLDAHARQRNTILIIDEAQNLSTEALEQLRLLTNLETTERKLLQIILIGQPELRDILNQQELKQMAQRITARYHLPHLPHNEIYPYLQHRLKIAGIHHPIFARNLIAPLYRFTHGIPRIINAICDRALLGAYAQEHPVITRHILKQAAREVLGTTLWTIRLWQYIARLPVYPVLGIAAGVSIIAAVFILFYDSPPPTDHHSSEWNTLHRWGNEENRIGQAQAFRALFARWNIDYQPTQHELPCAYARQWQLKCLTVKGNMGSLRRFNRPVVLNKLRNPNGRAFHVALIALDDRHATIAYGDDKIKISLQTLEDLWFGDYQLLWRAPPNYTQPINLSHHIPDWFVRHFSELNPDIAPSADNMRSWLKKFQITHHLFVDGILGPQTIIHLNNKIAQSHPFLIAAATHE